MYFENDFSLGLLKKSAPSRVINNSSMLHQFACNFDVANLNSEISYNSSQVYYNSKLCQLLFSRYLAPLIFKDGRFKTKCSIKSFSMVPLSSTILFKVLLSTPYILVSFILRFCATFRLGSFLFLIGPSVCCSR